MRIPVRFDGIIIERVDQQRAVRMSKASNAEVVRARKTKEIVGINLFSVGNDNDRKRRQSNPLTYSHDKATQDNLENVWMLKHIPSHTADIFGAVVNQLARAA